MGGEGIPGDGGSSQEVAPLSASRFVQGFGRGGLNSQWNQSGALRAKLRQNKENVTTLLFCLLAASWHELFDGRTLDNFRAPSGKTDPAVSWFVRDGALYSNAESKLQADLWTAEAYEDFELEFEWRVERGANTGIKYLIQQWASDKLDNGVTHETSLGFEFQLVDDASAAGKDSPLHVSGALYNYLAPSQRAARPAGEWNSARLVVNGQAVEHWINGTRVLAYTLGSPELAAALSARRLNSARMLEKLAVRRSHIAFQHHESAVAFRAIRIRALP